MGDVRVTGQACQWKTGKVEEYGFIAEHLGTDERTGRDIVLHPIYGRQVVRDDETVEEITDPETLPCEGCGAESGEVCRVGCLGLAAMQDAPPLAVPSDLCSMCGHRNDEAHHGRCIEDADTSTSMDGQITVAVPGEQMELSQ